MQISSNFLFLITCKFKRFPKACDTVTIDFFSSKNSIAFKPSAQVFWFYQPQASIMSLASVPIEKIYPLLLQLYPPPPNTYSVHHLKRNPSEHSCLMLISNKNLSLAQKSGLVVLNSSISTSRSSEHLDCISPSYLFFWLIQWCGIFIEHYSPLKRWSCLPVFSTSLEGHCEPYISHCCTDSSQLLLVCESVH